LTTSVTLRTSQGLSWLRSEVIERIEGYNI